MGEVLLKGHKGEKKTKGQSSPPPAVDMPPKPDSF